MSTTVAPDHRSVNRTVVLITPEEMRRRLGGISRSQEYKLLRDPDFPRPVTGTGLRRAYAEHEIDEYLAQRLAARPTQLELPLGAE